MRYLIFPFLLLLTGCVSTYIPPQSGEYAYLKVPKPIDFLQVLYTPQTRFVSLGGMDESGCAKDMARVSAESIDANGKLKVKANTEISFGVDSSVSQRSCSVYGAAVFDPNKEYELVFTQQFNGCTLRLNENKANGEVQGVTITRLRTFLKACK